MLEQINQTERLLGYDTPFSDVEPVRNLGVTQRFGIVPSDIKAVEQLLFEIPLLMPTELRTLHAKVISGSSNATVQGLVNRKLPRRVLHQLIQDVLPFSAEHCDSKRLPPDSAGIFATQSGAWDERLSLGGFSIVGEGQMADCAGGTYNTDHDKKTCTSYV